MKRTLVISVTAPPAELQKSPQQNLQPNRAIYGGKLALSRRYRLLTLSTLHPTQTPEKKHAHDGLPPGRRLLNEHLAAVEFVAEQLSIEPTKVELQVEVRLSEDDSAFA